jgi:predicted ATPase
MLKKLILENWKSFRYAELPIDPLTVLIGTNASGKSNAIEAFITLNNIARGEETQNILAGIRGEHDSSAFYGKEEFSLKVLVQGTDKQTEYSYKITIRTKLKPRITYESLIQSKGSEKSEIRSSEIHEIQLFQANSDLSQNSRSLNVSIHSKEIDNVNFVGSHSVLTFLSEFFFHVWTSSDFEQNQTDSGIDRVTKTLQGILVLEPIPQNMRNYSRLSSELLSDASNVAGVLAALPKREKDYVESEISKYVAHLPEKDIQKVWAEPVGRLGSDAMLYCEESWIPGEPPKTIDAKVMSDGTLRFIAIVTALLTRPEGSQLVIEEVDAGLHPSRAKLLLEMLRKIGEKRKIDILVTTHNPALLNALEPEMLPFIIVAHRDPQTGESKLTPLDNLQNLARLLAGGPIGDLASRGAIEKSLSEKTTSR